MKPCNRLIKGILTSLMVVMMLGFVNIPATHAQSDSPDAIPQTTETSSADVDTFKEGADQIKAVGEAPQDAKTTEDMVRQVAKLATWSHRLFLPLTNFFSFQIGNFLGTDYIYNGSMGKMLQKIWVISRNLVNIAFVFLLLWMALKEIFYVEKETNLKKNLIYFVLILVGVNFSWLGTRVVLDAANVVTHVVFAIPSGISNPPSYGQCQVNDDPEKPVSGACYPTTILAPVDSGPKVPLYYEDKEGDDDNCARVKAAYEGPIESGAAYETGGSINPYATEANKKFQRRTIICVENLNLIKYDQNTAVIYLTYGMARIQNLVNATGGSGQIDQLAVGVLLSLIIQIAYTVALMTLFIALVIRMMMLWLFVAFSPFLALMLYFTLSGEGAEAVSALKGKFDLDTFMKWAFVPAKVGAVFAVSFIMISAGQALGDINTTFVDNLASQSGFVYKLLQPQSLFMGIGSLQSFIWLLMSLVVLWMGVFAVLQDMPVVGFVSKWIEDKGRRVGKLVSTAPYWAPILPVGKEGARAPLKEILPPLDFLRKAESYAYGTGEHVEEVRALNRKAGSEEAKKQVGRAVSQNFTFTSSQANTFARAFGLELDRFLDKENQPAVEKALTASGANDTQITKIFEGLRKANRETSDERRVRADREAEAKKEAEAKAGVNPKPIAPPPAAPAAPKPQPPAPKP